MKTKPNTKKPALAAPSSSLPALAKLKTKVLELKREARRDEEIARSNGSRRMIDFFVGEGAALANVLAYIAEAMREEPEGNNQVEPRQ